MHPLVDSTGLNICGEGEWKVKKHGTEYHRAWRKVHLAIDAETLDVRAVEMTGHRQGDTTQAAELLSQLDLAELLASVSGDGAYDTRGFFYHRATTTERQAVERPGRFRSSPECPPGCSPASRGRLWKKWSGYHRRSLVETTMGRFKLLGERLAAGWPERQVAEVHVCCAILNTFNWLGMPVTVALA